MWSRHLIARFSCILTGQLKHFHKMNYSTKEFISKVVPSEFNC